MSDKQSRIDVGIKPLNGNRIGINRRPAIVLTCAEPQAMDLSAVGDSAAAVRVITADAFCAGLDEGVEISKHWLLPQLAAQPDAGLILLCAHYDCKFLTGAAFGQASGNQAAAPDDICLEELVSRKIELLRSLTALVKWEVQPTVTGCIYDWEFDWLSIYDDETKLFLPSNAHRLTQSYRKN